MGGVRVSPGAGRAGQPAQWAASSTWAPRKGGALAAPAATGPGRQPGGQLCGGIGDGAARGAAGTRGRAGTASCAGQRQEAAVEQWRQIRVLAARASDFAVKGAASRSVSLSALGTVQTGPDRRKTRRSTPVGLAVHTARAPSAQSSTHWPQPLHLSSSISMIRRFMRAPYQGRSAGRGPPAHSAPAASSSAAPRKPQPAPTAVMPALWAVKTSTSLSPT